MPHSSRRTHPGPAVIDRLVREVVDARIRSTGRSRLAILDAGGGTGTFAVPLAQSGHHVTVVDPSPDSLAALQRRVADADVADRVQAMQGDVCALRQVVPDASVDLVLCHNVLEVVDDAEAALRECAGVTIEGGALSVLVANRHQAVWAKALSGHLRAAHAMLAGVSGTEAPGWRRFTLEELTDLLDRAGYQVMTVHGVRVFADLLHPLGQHPERELEALGELEAIASGHPTFRGLGAQLHAHACSL